MSEVQFAKRHIRNRFSLMVLPHITEGLLSVYENARVSCEKNRQIDQTLKTFQNLLTFIPKWDEARLNAEVDRIQTASGCSYLEELLTATLITYLRAFAAVQYTNAPEIEVEFERPPLPRFIHELYKECARQCWTHAYLFKTYSITMEQQARNRRELETLLDHALDTTLDSFLPWKSIVDKYFKEPPAIPPTQMMEEEEKPAAEESKKGVKFASEDEEEDEEEDDESTGGGPPLQLSEETAELEVEDLEEKEKPEPEEDRESVVDLQPTEEFVMNTL